MQMSEHLPEPIQESAEASVEQPALEVSSSVLTPTPDTPLPADSVDAPAQSSSRVARPLAAAERNSRTVTPALSSSAPAAKITRPLVEPVRDEEADVAFDLDETDPDLRAMTLPLAEQTRFAPEPLPVEQAQPSVVTQPLAIMPIPAQSLIMPVPVPGVISQPSIMPVPMRPAITQPSITPVPARLARPPAGGSPMRARAPHSMLLVDTRRRLKRIYRLQDFVRKHIRHTRASERRTHRRLWTTIWTTTISLLLLLIVLSGVVTYIAYNFIVVTQGTYAGQVLTLRDLLPPDNLKIYDSQGALIDQLTDQGIHTEVSYKQIAPDLLNATVAIEDRTFWQNSGVDITGILRAAIADLDSGQQVQGGSTITQQLIKKLIVGDSDDTKRKL